MPRNKLDPAALKVLEMLDATGRPPIRGGPAVDEVAAAIKSAAA